LDNNLLYETCKTGCFVSFKINKTIETACFASKRNFAKQQVCFAKHETCFVSCFAKYETKLVSLETLTDYLPTTIAYYTLKPGQKNLSITIKATFQGNNL
jgi:hypothetical protein